MALYKEHRWAHFELVIWKIDAEAPENPEWITDLSKIDQKRFADIKNKGRRQQFCAARLALAHLCETTPQLSYSNTGAPQLKNYRGVSLSHSDKYAAAMLSKKHNVGIDIEGYREQTMRLSKRFLGTQELKTLADLNDLKRTTTYWSAKETLMKLHDRLDLDLRRDLKIEPFKLQERFLSKGFIKLHDQWTSYPLFIELNSDFCLCFSFD
jgi:4'-phosphopantetheinyl transferase